MKAALHLIGQLLLAGVMGAAMAQEVVISDGTLQSAIWRTLGKSLPVGTLTEEDMLSLTELDVSSSGVRSLDGLGGAHNLAMLSLRGNQLTRLRMPWALPV